MKRLLPEGSAATVAGALASSLRARRLTSRSREKAVLRLSDENLETLRTAAAPIDPRLRPRFLQAVAAANAPMARSESGMASIILIPVIVTRQ
jgi:hypothetical protein